MKPKTYYLHVNKKQGHWTIHGDKQCRAALVVTINVKCETVYKPERKDNPKFFIKCRGILKTVDFDSKSNLFSYEINEAT